MSKPEYEAYQVGDVTKFRAVPTPKPDVATSFLGKVVKGIEQLGWFKELKGGHVGQQYGGYHNNYGAPNYGNGYSGTGKGYSTPSYSSTPAGIIQIRDKNKKVLCEKEVSSYWSDWWDQAITVPTWQLFEEKGKTSVLVIPDYDVPKWTEGTVYFNACTYDAAKDYIESWHGLRLHDTDKQWLGRHPLATDDGIPQEYTITAIHQLVLPYGLGVHRVRFRAGLLTAGDEIMNWSKALGCNPFGLMDHKTTNKQALEQLPGMSEEQINDFFRFEYHEEPFRPSIVGERGWTNSATVSTGSGGGHAKYLAPRSHENNWVVSIQLAPLDKCQYQSPPILPEYVRRRGPMTVALEDITTYVNDKGDLVTFAVKLNSSNRFVSPAEAAALEKGGAPKGAGFQTDVHPVGQGTQQEGTQAGTATGSATHSGQAHVTKHACVICTKKYELRDFPQDMFVCKTCLPNAWTGWTCASCRGDLGHIPGGGAVPSVERVPNYIPLTGDKGEPTFQCPYVHCKQDISLAESVLHHGLREGAKQYESFKGRGADLTDMERRSAPTGRDHDWSFAE